MTGIEIFFGGSILLCNCILATYLIVSSKSDRSKVSEPIVPPPKIVSEEQTQYNHASDAIISDSGFNVENFVAELGEKFMAEIPRLLTAAIGDVSKNDVEFAEETDSIVSDEEPVISPPSAQLDEESTQIAFDTDIRDVDEFPPSEPDASGISIDELEEAVEVTLNEKATDEEKIKAGQVLEQYKKTQFIDAICTNERIGSRVDLCVTMAIRASVAPNRSTEKSQKVEKNSANNTNKIKNPIKKHSKAQKFNPKDFLSQYSS